MGVRGQLYAPVALALEEQFTVFTEHETVQVPELT